MPIWRIILAALIILGFFWWIYELVFNDSPLAWIIGIVGVIITLLSTPENELGN